MNVPAIKDILRLVEDLVDDSAAQEEAPKRIAVFAGPKQGVGKTAVCVNLALAWAGIQKRKVLILQFDPQCRRELGFLLGAEQPGSLAELANSLRGRAPSPADLELPTHWGVGALTWGAEGGSAPLDPRDLVRTLQALLERYDLFIDLDPGSTLQEFAFDIADVRFWITRPSLAYTEATFDRLMELRSLLFRASDFDFVVNQAGVPGALSRMELDCFFATMDRKVLSYMPWEDLLFECANRGKNLVIEDPRRPWVDALRPLLGRLLHSHPRRKPFTAWTSDDLRRGQAFLWSPERSAPPLPGAGPEGAGGRVAAFTGPRDGAGKTTLGLNLAMAWAAWRERWAVIVQLDPLCGQELGFLLGQKQVPSLGSLARELRAGAPASAVWRDRLDFTPFGVACVRFAENAQERAALAPEDIVGVLRALHRDHDLFLDVGPDPALQGLAVELADVVFSVLLPLRAHLETTCGQFLASPDLLAAVAKCEFVVNACDLHGAFTPEDLERFFSTMGKTALSRMPFEARLPELANAGKIWAVEKPKSGWVAALKPLLGALAEREPSGREWGPDLAARLRGAGRPVWEPEPELDAPAPARGTSDPLPRARVASAMDRERLWIREDPRHEGRYRSGLERIVGELILEQRSAEPRLWAARRARAEVDAFLGLKELDALSRRPSAHAVRELYAGYRVRATAKMAPFVYYTLAAGAEAAGDASLAQEIFGRFLEEDIDFRDVRRRLRALEASPRPPAAAAAPVAPAARLAAGRFELRGRIGAGALGPVFEGVEKASSLRAAVKELRPEIQRSAADLKRFLAAARTVTGLSGRGIVRLLEVDAGPERTLLVYEFAEGQPLSSILSARGRLQLDECKIFLDDVYQAVAIAHRAGVLHRDLKPANIMIGPDGAARVLDFSLSREAKDMAARLAGPQAAGTSAYLAPEQHHGRSSPAADVYAMGVTLYELLTGELPFPAGDSLAEKERARYLPARVAVPGLPAALDGFLLEALAPDPAKRIAGPAEFYDRLFTL